MGNLRWSRLPGGRAQVNGWILYDNVDFPYINAVNSCSRFWTVPGGTVDDVLGLIDANGNPTAMTTGGNPWRLSIYAYLTNSDPWVLTWTGSSTVTLASNDGAVTASGGTDTGNRREYTFTSGSLTYGASFQIKLEVSALGSGVSNLKVFRLSQESRMNAGHYFPQDYIDLYAPFYSFRFMDQQATNSNAQVLYTHRTLTTDRSWNGLKIVDYCGLATKSGNDYTTPNTITGSPSSWTSGMRIQSQFTSAPTFKSISSMSNAGTMVVTTSTAHGWSTGDKVTFSSNFSQSQDSSANFASELEGLEFTITVTGASTFTVPVNSTGFGAYPGSFEVCKSIRFKTSTLPFKRIVDQNLNTMTSSLMGIYTSVVNGNTDSGVIAINLVYNSDLDALVTSRVLSTDPATMPLEAMVQFANEANVNPWFCMPHGAETTFISSFATYVLTNLNSNLVAHYERSNEVWNSGAAFAQTPYGRRISRVKFGTGSDSFDQWYGWAFYQMATTLETVYSGQLTKMKKVFGVFAAQYGGGAAALSSRFDAPAAGTASKPISKANAIAIAPYFEASRSTSALNQHIWGASRGNASQKQAAVTYFDAQLNDDGSNDFTVKYLHDTVIPDWITIAAAPSAGVSAIQLIQYEGGPAQFLEVGLYTIYPSTTYDPGSGAVTLNSTDLLNAQTLYLASAECAATCRKNWDNFLVAGGLYPSQYTLVSDGTAGGPWGVIQPNRFATPSLLYTELRSFNGR